MRKFLLFCWLTFTITGSLWATPPGHITVLWDASPDATVTGYKVYYGRSSRTYTGQVDVGNVLTYVFDTTQLTPGVDWYIAATAYNAQRFESDYSNEIVGHIPLPPIMLKIAPNQLTINSYNGANLLVESTSSLANPSWAAFNLAASADSINIPIDQTKPAQFYRVSYAQNVQSVQFAKVERSQSSGPPPLPPAPKISFWKKLGFLLRYRPGHHADIKKGAELLRR